MSLRDVAFNVVQDYPGGCRALAPRMDKNETTLAHELHGTGIAKLGLADGQKITQLTGDLRILERFANNCGQRIVPLPEAKTILNNDCMLRLADSAAEFGELFREIGVDLSDGKISDNEMARIDRECGILMASLHALRSALADRNAQGHRG
jgi:hypothetical protein